MFDAQQRYTLAEYRRQVEAFPEYKYEYTEGNIRMMTGGSPAHGQIAMNIARVLNNALYEQECNVYSSDVGVQLNESHLYYPDLSVSCDPADWTRKKHLEAPSVVIEVMSPSTERTDKIEKLEVYQLYPTIQEILLVDSRRCQVRQYHRIRMHQWRDFFYNQMDDRIELDCIEVSLTVREIYHKVYLELEEEQLH